MPSKNVIKYYLPNSIYHIYNRGVEKRIIFQDKQDYGVFLSYIKEYLSPPPEDHELLVRELTGKYHDEIVLLAFCLMPNHFHLLLRQQNASSIKKFTQSLFTRYSMYFNKKYKRTGGLFQGTYKATNVIDKEFLLYVSKYIHLNPRELNKDIVNTYSSYPYYVGVNNTQWVDTKIILDEFKQSSYMKFNKIKSYKQFVEEWTKDMPQYEDM